MAAGRGSGHLEELEVGRGRVAQQAHVRSSLVEYILCRVTGKSVRFWPPSSSAVVVVVEWRALACCAGASFEVGSCACYVPATAQVLVVQ